MNGVISMKKWIAAVIIVFVVITMYFTFSYSDEKMMQIFNEYLIENIDQFWII